jgi:hypothetical protein
MKDKETTIAKRGPAKREAACFQTQHPILIPAGTILRQEPGKPGVFSGSAGYGTFTATDKSALEHPGTYKRVIA